MTKKPAKSELVDLLPEGSAGYLLWQAAMYWQRYINKVLAEFELTYTQFVVLAATGALNNLLTNVYQDQVAKYAKIDRMMTSRILAILESKNYVGRARQSKDARTKFIKITEEGEEILAKAQASVSRAELEFFDSDTTPATAFMKSVKGLLPR